MARYDGKLTAAEESAIDAAELLAALGARPAVSPGERQEAIIRYLSASDGWTEARSLLRGAFAEESEAADRAKLRTGRKGEGYVNQRTSEYLQRLGFKSSVIVND